MNNILTLVKIGLVSFFRGEAGRGKRKIKKPLVGFLILIWFIPLLITFTEIIRVIYDVFETYNQGDVIIVFGLLIATLIVFVSGIFYSLSSYYMAKDIPTYLSMPLKPFEITAARFLIALVYEYMTMCLVFLPIIIGFGIAATKGMIFYIVAVPVFLLLPILPLSLASVIVIFIMSFSKKAMNKDRFTLISSLLGLGIGVGINIGFQNLARSADGTQNLQQLLIDGRISLGEEIAGYFPGIINASRTLADNDFLQLGIFIIIAAAAFAVFLLVAKLLYFKGVIGISQQVARKEFNTDKNKGFTASIPIKTYFLKELKLIFRTPIYFMNLALIDILMPVLIAVPLLTIMDTPGLSEMRSVIISSVSNGILITGAFIMFVFISAMNGITATSISREGKQLYIMKYIPLPYKTQINAKLLSGVVVSMTGMVVVLVFAVLLIKVEFSVVVLMFLASANAVLFTRLTGLLIDASNPKLKWDNEQKAVKQNMNLVFNMIVGMIVAGLGVVFLSFVSQSLLVNTIVFIVGMLGVNLLLYKLVHDKVPKMLERIE